MKIVKKMAVVLLLVLLAMQFYHPVKNLSPGNHSASFITETNPSVEVRGILENACYNCHSDNTSYPWYNTIAPLSYWLADHVKDGKEKLNFSAWDTYASQKKRHKLEEVVEVIENGEMPLKVYTWMHPEAKLTQEQKNAVIDWAKSTRALYPANQQPQ